MIKKIALASMYPNEQNLLSKVMRFIGDDFKFADNAAADFSDTLFVLPTAEAGRLFREKAALFFKDRGGVMQLQTLLPEQLLFSRSEITCSEAEMLGAWFDILKHTDRKNYTHLLLSDADYSDEAMLKLAEQFAKAGEDILLESGMDLKTFSDTVQNENLRAKLHEFIRFEEMYREKISPLRDKTAVIADRLKNPQTYAPDIKNIILIECTELKNGIFSFLEKLSVNKNISMLIHTTTDKLCDFDEAGRPITDRLLSRKPHFNIENAMRTYPDPIQEALKIASFLDEKKLPEAIGVLNNDLAQTLTHILEDKKIQVYAPARRLLSSFYWYKLFSMLMKLQSSQVTYTDIYEWASDDSFSSFAGFDGITVRSVIELLQREHLIYDLDALIYFCRRLEDEKAKHHCAYETCMDFCMALKDLQKQVRALNNDDMPEALWSIFVSIAQCNKLDNLDINSAESSLEAMKKAIVEVRKVKNIQSRMLLFKHICNSTGIDDAELVKDDAVKFSGFLDLIWYGNKSLILGGFNEDAFKTSAVYDMLFPENVRRELNWSSAWSRFGADIHRFDILTEQYLPGNALITFSAADKQGNPQSLPRMLFAVDDSSLLKYCDLFYNDKLLEKITVKHNDAEKSLYAPNFCGDIPERISVTAFKNYLGCPYTFYLKNILSCNDPQMDAFELQSNQFGTLLHAVFENYGKTFKNDIPDPKNMEDFCGREFDRQYAALLGNTRNNITIMQCAEQKKLLKAFIEHELDYRNSCTSSEIIHTEYKLEVTYAELYDKLPASWKEQMPEVPDEIRNISIVGKIDRIDKITDSEGNRSCCILDYKTGKAKSPAEAHLSSSFASHLDDKMISADTDKYFCDMQLVIYSLFANFLGEKLGLPHGAEIKCGYYNLPEDKKIEIVFFDKLDSLMLQKGAAALQYILTEIFTKHNFWPPSAKEKYGIAALYLNNCREDDFAEKETSDE